MKIIEKLKSLVGLGPIEFKTYGYDNPQDFIDELNKSLQKKGFKGSFEKTYEKKEE